MDEKYIVNIKGKKFVTYNGLLAEAHKAGLEDMRITEMHVDLEKKSAWCMVACKIKEKEFMGVGSATPENCGSMVKNHFVEMSNTRAKSRVLRDALNIDMTSVEELTDSKEDKPKASEFGKEVNVPNKCADCNNDISDAEKDYSIRNHNKTLCRSCQKKK